MKKRILSLLLCLALCLSMVAMLSGCKSKKVDAFVIMTDALDGLFNPFYSTSAGDSTIVGMTQISMLSAAYRNGEVEVAYGDNEAVVAKDYEIVTNEDGTVSYYFVLKNGIKFSDGHPLTMEDVLFNIYTYLDPGYTGSNTLNSTKILGLSNYRAQILGAGSEEADKQITSQAATRAQTRINELINLFKAQLKVPGNDNEAGYDVMIKAIESAPLGDGYKSAISNDPDSVTNEQLKADYEHTLELFEKELNTDYISAQESYTDAPYDEHEEFQDEIFCFMFAEGYVGIEYELGADNKIDRTKIKTLTKNYGSAIDTKEKAIEYVKEDKIARELDMILTYWATAGDLATEYTAKAKEVILHENVADDGTLKVPNISGVVSLGHSDQAGQKITVNGTEYTIASEHDENGVVVSQDAYDILKVTIEGVDPKAIWNFALTIAPQHYYGEGAKTPVDIKNNQFGVDFSQAEFHSKILQSLRNVKIPMGAGAYMASNADNASNPGESEFFRDNVVYFKRNDNFQTVGTGLNNAHIEKIRYQVISSNNAIPSLENGTVHYISPSLTTDNYEKLEAMSKKGYTTLSTDQLGYGYIGINASYVNDMYLRRAIMCAMNTAQALDYYRAGTADQIYWNMSTVSWAYPTGADRTDNNKNYPQMGTWNEQVARDNIQSYMDLAGVSADDPELSLVFTIAGSTLQDHPTYKVFRDAAALLNDMGWDIRVECDTQALVKISTGSLAVWAAAWSSSLDPDMYQVYHKDSSATSVKAWGYPYLLSSQSSDEEKKILDDLSDLIDQGRETNDKAERKEIYKQAMGLVLDLAVELPVYQRDVLYAYNANVIDASSVPSEVNPYSSPLDRIWEIKFVD